MRLVELGEHGSSMCQVASDCLRDATKALLAADLSLAERVIAADVRLDEMRSNAEKVALELLALEAPVASDLRTVVSAIWIVADMQRMGHWQYMWPRLPGGGIRRTSFLPTSGPSSNGWAG